MTEKKPTLEVAFDALREMYQEAEPPLDFDYALENPEEFDDRWWENHSLERERQEEIVDKHCEKYDLPDGDRADVSWMAILNYGPSYGLRDE